MCSLGIEPTTFCATDAMLYHWATQEHITCVIKTKMYLFIFFIDFLNEYILCSIMCTDLDFWLLLTMQKEYWKSDEVYIHVINLIVLYVCVYIYIYIYIYIDAVYACLLRRNLFDQIYRKYSKCFFLFLYFKIFHFIPVMAKYGIFFSYFCGKSDTFFQDAIMSRKFKIIF